jgi:hypothetical protein
MLDHKWNRTCLVFFSAMLWAPIASSIAQQKALVNNAKSPFARQVSVDMEAWDIN